MIWTAMKARCASPNDPAYPNYGGRGISVCARWRASYVDFLTDMGARPSLSHSLDRINNDGDYEPGNCRWATKSEQVRNSRHNVLVTVDGVTKCVTDWAIERGVNPSTVSNRLFRGWTPLDAVTIPVLIPRRRYRDVRL